MYVYISVQRYKIKMKQKRKDKFFLNTTTFFLKKYKKQMSRPQRQPIYLNHINSAYLIILGKADSL